MKEQIFECSDNHVLACRCGERVVLVGRIEDWYQEDRLNFTCECGTTLSFADSLPTDWNLFQIIWR